MTYYTQRKAVVLALCAATSLAFMTASTAALKPLASDELETVSGAEGLDIDLDYNTTQDISYIPGPDSASSLFRLIFGETNFDIEFSGLGVDVATLPGGVGAISFSLPDEVSLSNFNSGILNLSLDDIVGNSSLPVLPPPMTRQYQVVASAAQDLTNVGPGTMNDNDYDLELQDVSVNNVGTPIGSGNLRILDWDRASGGTSNDVMRSCNSSGGGCSTQSGGFLTTNGGIARYSSGYGYIAGGYWRNAPTQGITYFTAPGSGPFGAFGSANTTPHTRDSRILVSIEKETDLRFYMDNTDCYASFFGDWRCDYSPSDPDVLDPAIVVLDAAGNLVTSDISSGGINNCSAIGGGGICSDDTDKVTNALVNITLGDRYLNAVPDRRLGGAIIGTSPEQQHPVPGIPEHTALSPRASIYLGGSVQVFGVD